MPGFRAGQLTYATRRFTTWHQCRRRTKGQLTYATVLIERDTACIARGSVSGGLKLLVYEALSY